MILTCAAAQPVVLKPRSSFAPDSVNTASCKPRPSQEPLPWQLATLKISSAGTIRLPFQEMATVKRQAASCQAQMALRPLPPRRLAPRFAKLAAELRQAAVVLSTRLGPCAAVLLVDLPVAGARPCQITLAVPSASVHVKFCSAGILRASTLARATRA